MNEIIINKNYNDIIFTMSLLDLIKYKINKDNINYELNIDKNKKKYLKYKLKYLYALKEFYNTNI